MGVTRQPENREALQPTLTGCDPQEVAVEPRNLTLQDAVCLFELREVIEEVGAGNSNKARCDRAQLRKPSRQRRRKSRAHDDG